jgi:hypothetical protein
MILGSTLELRGGVLAALRGLATGDIAATSRQIDVLSRRAAFLAGDGEAVAAGARRHLRAASALAGPNDLTAPDLVVAHLRRAVLVLALTDGGTATVVRDEETGTGSGLLKCLRLRREGSRASPTPPRPREDPAPSRTATRA